MSCARVNRAVGILCMFTVRAHPKPHVQNRHHGHGHYGARSLHNTLIFEAARAPKTGTNTARAVRTMHLKPHAQSGLRASFQAFCHGHAASYALLHGASRARSFGASFGHAASHALRKLRWPGASFGHAASAVLCDYQPRRSWPAAAPRGVLLVSGVLTLMGAVPSPNDRM